MPLTIVKPQKENPINKTIKTIHRGISNNNYLLFMLLVLAFIGELIEKISMWWYIVVIVFLVGNLIRDLTVIFKRKK